MGNIVNSPLVKNTLRVFVNSYVIFAAAKRPDDVNPWATIINIAPCHPRSVLVIIPAVIIPICLTDLYAIIDFRSD